MFGTFAKRIRSPDYPWAPTVEERQQYYKDIARDWAHGMKLDRYVPSKLDDEAFTRRLPPTSKRREPRAPRWPSCA